MLIPKKEKISDENESTLHDEIVSNEDSLDHHMGTLETDKSTNSTIDEGQSFNNFFNNVII